LLAEPNAPIPGGGRALIAIVVVSPTEHEVAGNAQARADGNAHDGQKREQECAGENKTWHRAPLAEGYVAIS
jgi:hypothetical protein